MTTIVWPEALSTILSGTMKNTATDTFVNDNAEVGSAARRARFTRKLNKFEFTLRVTEDELVIFENFYTDDLCNGVEKFEWTHPTKNKTYTVRIDSYPDQTHQYLCTYDLAVSLSEQ